MVAVDDPDPPPEAKIKQEYMAVPSSALPNNALAAAASAWGETSTDELPDNNEETYGEAEDPAYAYARAEASFRRFSKRLHTIMAVRFINRPRKTENMLAPNTDPSTVVPELAHKKMDAPSPYEVGSGIYVNPLAEASAKDGATERSARSSASVASTADDVRVIMLQQELQLNQLRARYCELVLRTTRAQLRVVALELRRGELRLVERHAPREVDGRRHLLLGRVELERVGLCDRLVHLVEKHVVGLPVPVRSAIWRTWSRPE